MNSKVLSGSHSFVVILSLQEFDVNKLDVAIKIVVCKTLLNRCFGTMILALGVMIKWRRTWIYILKYN